MERQEMKHIVEIINERPISTENPLSFIGEQELSAMKRNQKDIDYLYSSMYNPLKVVIMGEVKAGKSTLLNAIVEDDVSNMGVTETTAVILEITHGIERKATVYKKNGEIKHLSINTMNKQLTENQKNEIFFANIEKIKVSYPLPKLQDIEIVDTPGLETITASNQETTNNYIQQADVVLWVMSVHHLGQSGIDEKIMEVIEYGKPIIMLINRIDQLNQNQSLDDVLSYVDDQYGLYIETAFPVSAHFALEGLKNNNSELYNDSGLPLIMDYLEENIEKSSKEVKQESLKSSVIQIIEQEMSVALIIKEQIDLYETIFKDRKEDINSYKKEIKSFIEDEIEQWVNYEFLREEELETTSSTENENKASTEHYINRYMSPYYIQNKIESFYKKLSDTINKKMFEFIETMGEKIEKEEKVSVEKMNKVLIQYQNTSLSTTPRYSDNNEDLVEGAKTGAMISGTYGIATALYAALLGPSAAYIGIGAALSSVLPPVLFAGVASGIVWKYISKDSNKKKIRQQVINKFKEVRDSTATNIQEPKNNLIDESEQFLDNALDKIITILLLDSSIEEIQALNDKNANYIEVLQNQLKNFKTSNQEQLEPEFNFDGLFDE